MFKTDLCKIIQFWMRGQKPIPVQLHNSTVGCIREFPWYKPFHVDINYSLVREPKGM